VLFNLTQRSSLYKAISDGENGAIILFLTGVQDIEQVLCIQRLDSWGNKLWGDSGIVAATALGEDDIWIEDMVCDTIEREHFVLYNYLEDLANVTAKVQKFDCDGNPLWPNFGVTLCDTIVACGSQQMKNSLAPDLNGGVYAIYKYESPTGQWFVYAQHLDANGNQLWGTPNLGLLLYGPYNASDYPEIAPDGEGGIISFDTWYIRRISPDGNFLWSHHYGGHDFFITPGDSNDFYFTWHSELQAGYMRGQRIQLNGTILWPGDYIQLSNYTCETADGEYGVFFRNSHLFLSFPTDGRNIVSQSISPLGGLEWGVWGILTTHHSQWLIIKRSTCTDQEDGLITVFHDLDYDLYAKRVLGDGSLGGNLPGIEDLSVQIIGDSVILQWSSIPDAEIYKVYISSSPYILPGAATAVITDTFYVDTTSVNQGSRFYQVRWEQ
jgi:hypothetical protein